MSMVLEQETRMTEVREHFPHIVALTDFQSDFKTWKTSSNNPNQKPASCKRPKTNKQKHYLHSRGLRRPFNSTRRYRKLCWPKLALPLPICNPLSTMQLSSSNTSPVSVSEDPPRGLSVPSCSSSSPPRTLGLESLYFSSFWVRVSSLS
jgi:hypothetical protein